MPQHEFPSEHGDLYVTVTVIIPTKLSAADKDGIVKILSGATSSKDRSEL